MANVQKHATDVVVEPGEEWSKKISLPRSGSVLLAVKASFEATDSTGAVELRLRKIVGSDVDDEDALIETDDPASTSEVFELSPIAASSGSEQECCNTFLLDAAATGCGFEAIVKNKDGTNDLTLSVWHNQ